MADILVVGLSARALSASGRRAGYTPLAADFFMDLDLEEHAERCVRIDANLQTGLAWEPLSAALNEVSEGREPVGIVCGAGFEDRPEFLDRLAERWPLFGNGTAAVRRAKDPEILAELCADLGIPHPETRFDGGCGTGWLRKQRGGSGGAHVSEGSTQRSDSYWQRRVEGDSVSALVLGNGRAALTVGLSAQWADSAPGARFRYSGAVRPAGLPSLLETQLAQAAESIVAALDLVGLNSVDFLVGEYVWHLLEVNPRPGATLDIFDSDDAPLFALHIAACRGELPAARPRYSGAAAARIVYAARDVARMPAIDWPDWTADRQCPDTAVNAGAPLCTVLAHAKTADESRALVMERGEQILATLKAAA